MRWYCALLCVLSALVPGLGAAQQISTTTINSVSFINANQQLHLQPSGSHYLMQFQEKTLKVQLSNRLLVKTGQQLNAAALQVLHPAIDKVQELAKLKQASWWLVTTKDSQLVSVLSSLQHHAEVLAVQPDLLQQRQYAGADKPSGLKKQYPLTSASKPAKTVRVAIIDDGFDLNHPALQKLNIALQYDADVRVADASPKFAQDQHGTLVAAVLLQTTRQYGVEPELVLIRQVSNWTSDLLLGFSVARMMQADIVNSSWVLPFLPDPLRELLNEWQQQRAYFVFAAGNNASDACESNAFSNLAGALIVAAAKNTGELWPYSNHGRCIDLKAPAYFQIYMGTEHKPSFFTGTSAAATYVSAILAVKLAFGVNPAANQLQQWVLPRTGSTLESDVPSSDL